ncbi:MAG: hypothetical protein U0228_11850 [Myxococcaceae bacterium]
MRRNGETNPGTIVAIIAVALGAFYGVWVAPVYWDNLEVKEAVTEAFNVYWVSGENEARVKLLGRLNNNNDVSHIEMNSDGEPVEKPGFGVPEDWVKITEENNGTKVRIRVEWERTVQFKPLEKKKRFHMVVEKTGARVK